MTAEEYPIAGMTISDIVASLTNTRDPNAHAASHKSGATDALKLTDLAVADNVTANNATTSHPGLLKTLSGTSTEFMNGEGEWATPAGGSGTDITYPGSSSVFLNGLGAFAVPSSSGSVFKPWITIGKTGSGADYECDGVADHIQIQQAITAASSGCEILFLDGAYYLTSQVSIKDKNLTIRGVGQVTLNLSTGGNFGLYFAGSTGASATLLSSNADIGDVSISVISATGFSAGQNIIIYDDNDWSDDTEYTGVKTGEMHEIWYVDGTTLYFRDTLQRAYTTVDSASAKSFSPVSIKCHNISFVGPLETGSQLGIGIRFGNVIRITDCTFKKCGGAGIYMYTCYDAHVTRNTIRDSNMTGLGYGVCASTASAKIKIYKNTISGCRHDISITTDQSQPGMNRDILIDGNTLYGAQSGVIDSHPNLINWVVTNNVIYQSGVQAIQDGSQMAIITGNEIYGQGIRPRDEINNPRNKLIANNIIHGGFLYYDVQQNAYDSLIIKDNIVDGGDSTQVYIYQGSSNTKDADTIQISGNTMTNSANRAIDIGLENQTYPSCIDVSNNIIRDCSAEGIYMYVEATQANDVTINNNLIRGANTGNNTDAAIRVYNVVGGIISGNKVTDPNGYNGTGIATGTGCDYCTLIGNVAKGMTGTKYALTGANNISEHNSELA